MRFLRTVMVTAIAAGALAVPASAVAAPITSISVGPVQLGPQAVSLSLPLTVQCHAGWNLAYGQVSVAQASGSRLKAQGFASFSENFPGIPCARPVTLNLAVIDGGPFAFKKGDAAVSPDVTVFNPTTGNFFEKVVSQAIRIAP